MTIKPLLKTLSAIALLGASLPALAEVPPEPIKPGDKYYRPEYACNCVDYARAFVPSLPRNLWTTEDKKRIKNTSSPKKGRVAIHNFNHVSVVVDVDDSGKNQSLSIVEANFKTCQLTRRTARGKDMGKLEKELNIYGYYKP